MKVYTVTYFFKNKRDYEKYSYDMDNHAVFKYLTNKKINLVGMEDECQDDDGNKLIELYFQHKKDAKAFSEYFGIDEKVTKQDYENFNPWLPDGCDDYDEVMEIYGDIPGGR